MKNKFEFLGIKSPERSTLNRTFFKEFGYPDSKELIPLVKTLWQRPEREFQYFAMELCAKFNKKFKENHLELIEYLITHKSWWDTVDFIASNLAGVYFKIYPDKIEEVNNRWIHQKDFWYRRTALLFQLKYKQELDKDILAQNILICKEEKEFFIKKAIGWALREYSKYNAQWVIEFVKQHELSPLSKKEALKWLTGNNIA